MKKTILYLGILALAACSGNSVNTPQQAASVPAKHTTVFPWLHGNWTIDYGETKIYESWQQENDRLLTGTGYVVTGKDTVVRELMQIEQIGGRWVFIAQVNDHAPVLFTATQNENDTRIVFENSEHDFPQIVTYGTGADGLYAFVEGKEKGKQKKEEYRFRRLK